MPANTHGCKWIRPEKRLSIYLRDGYRCCYCGRDLHHVERQRDRTLDHVLPRSQGGTNDAGNLVTSCLTCNIRKGNRWYQPALAYDRRGVDLEPFKRVAQAMMTTRLDYHTHGLCVCGEGG